MIDISIIVPIYNASKYLEKCLDSLINQTKKELEFILINDGSTDKSEDIIKKYKDKRIKYFKTKNRGIGKTRNFGIEKSSGKYLMFLDSDDYLETNACEVLYKKAEKENLDLLVFDYYRVEKTCIKEVKIPSFKTSNIKENKYLLLNINLGPCNKIYKSNSIKNNNIKFDEELKYEDTLFVIMAIYNAKKIAKLDQTLHYYVIHEKSQTTVRDEKVFDIIKMIDKIRIYLKSDKEVKETLDKLTIKILTNYTIQQRYQSDRKLAMKFIDEVFKYLEKEIPDYKNNKYYQGRSMAKRTIEKSKTLTKIYTILYNCKIIKKKVGKL